MQKVAVSNEDISAEIAEMNLSNNDQMASLMNSNIINIGAGGTLGKRRRKPKRLPPRSGRRRRKHRLGHRRSGTN